MDGVRERIVPIPGWEGLYLISESGVVYSKRKPLGLSPDVVNGYRQVTLRGHGRIYREKVHVLMLKTFVGPRPTPQHEGCHEDGDRSNNRLTNLRWDTPGGNAADKERHGTAYRPKGELHHAAKLTAKQAAEVRRRIANGEKQRAIATEFGVSPATICHIGKGKSWT